MSQEISPEEAHDLMEDEDYVYVDVRTQAEFEGGHPEGAYNVPVRVRVGGGMAPNEAFVDVMKANFPLDAKLIVGCQMGGRSKAAAALLVAAGFTQVKDQRAGWGGRKDAFGGTAELGWQGAGLPVSLRAAEGRDYAALGGK
jgi:rhodanese-related sulfurtransferase